MTTVEAPASHLRENPFDLAQQQLHRVADVFKIDPNLIQVLKECKKSVVVSVPVVMDDSYDLRLSRQAVSGHATYSDFREFSVTTAADIK